MKVGDKIRKIRELKNYSQCYMADCLNISQKTYSRIENDEMSPTVELLYKVSEILEVRFETILNLNTQNILNNSPQHQTGDEFNACNATEVRFVKELYERLIKSKDDLISELQSEINRLKS